MHVRTLAVKRSTILSAVLVAIVIVWTAAQGVQAMELPQVLAAVSE